MCGALLSNYLLFLILNPENDDLFDEFEQFVTVSISA